jgi:hypothetical protein
MSAYRFAVLDVAAEPYAATPQLTARLRIEQTDGDPVHAMLLRCQVRIEPQRRRYEDPEADALRGLFGQRERWADTLRPLLWMQTTTAVPGFTDATEVDLPLPCTYDLDVVGTRYLHALGAGEVPLDLLFSGTAFTRGGAGFAVHQIPWDSEARYRMPVAVWREMIDAYFPGTGWIRLDGDVLALLADYRARHGMTGWDETVRTLLAREDVP